jgi:AcrR family transcriptional regulator
VASLPETDQPFDGEVKRESRRNPDTRRRTLDATLRLLSEGSYRELTIEGIAARAGVGKASIYRWWPSKGSLVLDALAEVFPTFERPATGDAHGDLRELTTSVAATMHEDRYGLSIPQLAAALSSAPDLGEAFMERCVLPNRRTVLATLESCIASGALSNDVDLEFLADLLAAIGFFRVLVLHRPVGDEYADSLTDLILDGRLPSKPSDR